MGANEAAQGADVVLLTDDTGLTQLAGIPAVAWQTPWSEITNIELVRLHHQLALFATIGGVRYCWRNREITDFDESFGPQAVAQRTSKRKQDAKSAAATSSTTAKQSQDQIG